MVAAVPALTFLSEGNDGREPAPRLNNKGCFYYVKNIISIVNYLIQCVMIDDKSGIFDV